jgi:hypothetical protein
VIGEPPLFDGADQERLTCVLDADVATKFVGVPGIVIDDEDEGLADASFDAAPEPAEFIAETLYEYEVPVFNPE